MQHYTKNTRDPKDVFPPSHEGGGKISDVPDPEVPAIPKRRRFDVGYKRKILKEIAACNMRGEKGMILRREGLFSSQIAQWRKNMQTPKKKSKLKSNSLANENARLKRRVARLEAKIEQKDYIIEAQKKMSEILDRLDDANRETRSE